MEYVQIFIVHVCPTAGHASTVYYLLRVVVRQENERGKEKGAWLNEYCIISHHITEPADSPAPE